VDETIANKKGTNLIVINSVCGCAAGKARPGIAMALKQAPVRPDELTTVFAGGDLEATARVREHLGTIPPSSPSMALYKDGELVHFIRATRSRTGTPPRSQSISSRCSASSAGRPRRNPPGPVRRTNSFVLHRAAVRSGLS